MSEMTLFDMDPAPAVTPAEPEPKLSADRRRTIRQLQTLENGRHPIGLCFGFVLRLHDQAAPAGDREAPGLRCGSCRFRELQHGPHNGTFAKCMRGDGSLASFSASSDVRAWWPACTHYEPPQAADGTEGA